MRSSVVMLLALACTMPVPNADSNSAREPACESIPPEWPDATTTLSRTVIPDARLPESTALNPAFPEGLAAAEGAGLGGWSEGAGEAHTLRQELAPAHPAGAGPNRKSLAMFFHESDAQIADTESPTRLMNGDAMGATQSAARPQELYALHALDALVRAVNAIHQTVSVDFALVTGDNADSTQKNETEWFRDTLDGTRLRPDSGRDDAQLDEDCNDPIEAFTPVGLAFPWYAVAGNHDVLVQGNFALDDYIDAAVGSDAPYGTRDLSEQGGPVVDTTVPDAERALLERSDLAAVYLDSPASPGPVGHGFTENDVRTNAVTWSTSPVQGLRIIAVDANPAGPGEGVLSEAERDTHLIPALVAAQAADELILVTSHYATGELPMEGGGRLGDLLVQYPNVVLTVAGHYHVNRIAPYGTPGDAGAFWEIQTASTVDWPGQGRLVELVDNGDGTLSVYTTLLDYPSPDGSMAARARALTLVDWQSGWRSEAGAGAVTDRNCELVQVLPDGWAGVGGDVRSERLP